LDSAEIIAGLRQSRSGMAADATPRTVFLALRDLRNRW